MENLRVRRAGYCNRQPYELFVARYKMLSPRTWPVWRKDMKEGATILIDTLGLKNAVAFGKTKIFIKEPSTLYVSTRRRHGLFVHASSTRAVSANHLPPPHFVGT